MCVGFNFALQEVKIFIAQLVWRYEWIKGMFRHDRLVRRTVLTLWRVDGNVETEYDPFFQLIRYAQIVS
jgi:hypothetical protein